MLVTIKQLKEAGAKFSSSYMSKLTSTDSYAVINGCLQSKYCSDKIELAISLKREFVMHQFSEKKKNYVLCFNTTQTILDALNKIKENK